MNNLMFRPGNRGRKQIFTSETNFNDINVLANVLNDALKIHRDNVNDMNFLINYYLGKQPVLYKEKKIRKDVNNKIVVNLASSAIRDVQGYTFGNPVVYASRTLKCQDELARINDANEFENKSSVDSDVAEDMLICGVGYRALFPEKVEAPDEEGFRYACIDPRNAFIIRSTDIGNAPVLAVIISYEGESNELSNLGTTAIYHVYSKNRRWVFKTAPGSLFGVSVHDYIEPNEDTYIETQVLNTLPIEEFRCNKWYLGFFETVLDILDGINLTASDTLDDMEQKIRSKLVVTGIDPRQLTDEVPTGEFDSEGNPKKAPFQDAVRDSEVIAFTGQQGVNQDAKYVTNELDYTGVSEYRNWLEQMYYYILGLPSRTNRASGGQDTGSAVILRDGWASLETVARRLELSWLKSERNSLKRLLEIMKTNKEISNIKTKDIDITIGRNKYDNILSKVNAGAILAGMNLYDPVDITKLMNITTDPEEMVARGKKYQEALQKELLKQSQLINNQNGGENSLNTEATEKTDKSKEA